jgi:hypothetical protein
MIKREHIKQAIDAISMRDADIGYSLDEMLARGLIDVPAGSGEAAERNDLYFLFEDQKVRVNRVLFFNEGPVPIEQGLLIKYGELVKKQELLDKDGPFEYREASREIRRAGLRLMVSHEIDYAITRLKKYPGTSERERGDSRKAQGPLESGPEGALEGRDNRKSPGGLIAFLEEMKKGEPRSLEIDLKRTGYPALFRGLVDAEKIALFIPLPICMESLMQVADINLEFFHVRFLLECLIRGLEKNIFACVVGQRVVGLVYLVCKHKLIGQDLEIKFLATLRGRPGDRTGLSQRPPKGIGTFLTAGVWMLWKTMLPEVKKISLDAEVGARRFYESMGFEPMGLSAYLLKQPKGCLLKSILIITRHCRDLRQGLIEEIGGVIRKQVKALRRKGMGEKAKSARRVAVASLKECLSPEARPEFGKMVFDDLIRYHNSIPESDELIRFGLKNASDIVKAYIRNAARTGS